MDQFNVELNKKIEEGKKLMNIQKAAAFMFIKTDELQKLMFQFKADLIVTNCKYNKKKYEFVQGTGDVINK